MKDESNKTINKPTKRDIGLWVGIMAIAINIITVSVYMYQARIMQEQQHASAWPYLEWLPSYNEETFYIEISNNGIGPAIIKNVDISLDGKHYANIDSLFAHLIGTIHYPRAISTVQNRVLPAGKSIRAIQVNSPHWAQYLFVEMRKHEFTLSICYESIYGDAWTSEGIEVIESQCHKEKR